MSRNPITKVRAKGDAFAIGHALGKASAEALVTRVFATEEYRALDAQWRVSDYLGQPRSRGPHQLPPPICG
jgi:hypothetical protein